MEEQKSIFEELVNNPNANIDDLVDDNKPIQKVETTEEVKEESVVTPQPSESQTILTPQNTSVEPTVVEELPAPPVVEETPVEVPSQVEEKPTESEVGMPAIPSVEASANPLSGPNVEVKPQETTVVEDNHPEIPVMSQTDIPVVENNNISNGVASELQEQIKHEEQPVPENNQALVRNTEEDYVEAYVGKNYKKISKRIFNIPAFFFSSFYMFYRKMFGYGLLFYLIMFAISMFVSPTATIIVNLLAGFFVNKLYIRTVRKRTKKIVSEREGLGYVTLKNICEEKGGTSVGKIFGGFAVVILLTIVISVALTLAGITTSISGYIDISLFNFDFNKSKEKENNSTGVYDGVLLYSNSVNLDSEFSFTIPGAFEDSSDKYYYSYQFNGTDGVFNTCSFDFGNPEGFNDAQNLITQLSSYNENSTPVEETSINGTKVYWTSFTNDFGTTYYYSLNKRNKAFLMTFEVQQDAPSDCESYRERILNSFKSK